MTLKGCIFSTIIYIYTNGLIVKKGLTKSSTWLNGVISLIRRNAGDAAGATCYGATQRTNVWRHVGVITSEIKCGKGVKLLGARTSLSVHDHGSIWKSDSIIVWHPLLMYISIIIPQMKSFRHSIKIERIVSNKFGVSPSRWSWTSPYCWSKSSSINGCRNQIKCVTKRVAYIFFPLDFHKFLAQVF